MPQQKFIVQLTTLPYCDDITRLDGSSIEHSVYALMEFFNFLVALLLNNSRLKFFLASFFLLWLKNSMSKFCLASMQCCGSVMFIPDPDFLPIPDPKTSTKERGEKK
jgi:hypothetical protein